MGCRRLLALPRLGSPGAHIGADLKYLTEQRRRLIAAAELTSHL